MSAALDNLHINFHFENFSWLVFAGCESWPMVGQFTRASCARVYLPCHKGIGLFPSFDDNPAELDSVFIVE